jgi:hypothetical protein
MGWFGPRGLASIVLMLITVERIEGIRVSGTIGLAVITTVIISVLPRDHCWPGKQLVRPIIATLPPDAPEKESVEELTALQGIETTENIHKEPY